MHLVPRALRIVTVAVVLAGALTVAAPATATNDSLWPQQWGPEKIGAPAAWAFSTGAGVRVGIVDTGVDLNHPDLQGKVVASAACVGTGGNPAGCAGTGQDADGHGTHVAGIVAATRDNGIGVAGVAPDARLVVARVFQGQSAELADVIAGIRWVVDQGAKVVNLSLGEDGGLLSGLLGSSNSLAQGVEYAWSKGAIPVLAAGNSNFLGFGSANYGAINAIVVGATGRNDELSSYSSSTGNAKWAVLAPGGNSAAGGSAGMILSTYAGGEYARLEGTSMAAPHVSGALAVLLGVPGMTQRRAVDLVLGTADRRLAGVGGCAGNCAGRLSLSGAITASGAAPTTQPPAGPPPTAAATTTTRAPRPPRTTTTRAPTTTTAEVPVTEPPPPVEETTTVPPLDDGPATALAARAPDDDEPPVGPAGALGGVLLVAVGGWTGVVGLRSRRR